MPAQVNSGCAVDRHSQRAAWCPGRFFSGSCSLHMNAPVFARSLSVTGAHTHTCPRDKFTHYELQQQRSLTFLLTPMKCPHLLSHEMTGQVDSGALDLFVSPPHVVSHSAVVSCCSAKLCSFLGKDGLLGYRLRTPCNSEHSVFIGQYPTNRRRITLQPNMSVAPHVSHCT